MDDINLTKLRKYFSSEGCKEKYSLYSIREPLRLGLAILLIAEDETDTTYLSSEHIEACLEWARININNLQISRAFARADRKIKSKKENGVTLYRIMEQGRELIKPFIYGGPIKILSIEAKKPHTARKKIEEILSSIDCADKVKICDPYLGVTTLDNLRHIPTKCRVEFLTENIQRMNPPITTILQNFCKEHKNIEFKMITRKGILHDRYILTSNNLLLIGHGLKDIGNKESFIVEISTSFARDVIEEKNKQFTQYWNSARKIE